MVSSSQAELVSNSDSPDMLITAFRLNIGKLAGKNRHRRWKRDFLACDSRPGRAHVTGLLAEQAYRDAERQGDNADEEKMYVN